MAKYRKRTGFLIIIFILLGLFLFRPDAEFVPHGAAVASTTGAGIPIKVLNWNILRGTEGDWGGNWKKRKKAYRAILSNADFDILGFQEVLPEQLQFFRTVLDDYEVVAVGRRDGRNRGEHNPIFFRKDRFELLAKNTFWLSKSPTVPSTGWGELYPRICTWVELRDKRSRQTFRVYNTHLQLSPYAQPFAAKLIADHVGRADMPALLMGDFNSHVMNTLDIFKDKGLISADSAAGRTYHIAGKGLFRLDHILMTDHWSSTDGAIIRRKVDGVYPSDHFGMWAALEFTMPGPR